MTLAADRPRIFGIGLNKTGTSSLHAALEVLGIRSLHYGGMDTMQRVFQALDEGAPLLRHVDEGYDAFLDTPVPDVPFPWSNEYREPTATGTP